MQNLSYENEFGMQVHFLANQSHFHENGFTLRLTLKQRHKGTRKWPISFSMLCNTICLHYSRFCIVDCRMGNFESFHWCYMRQVQTTWHPHKTACSVTLNSFDNVTCLYGFPQSFMQIEPKRQNIWILCELFRHLFV